MMSPRVCLVLAVVVLLVGASIPTVSAFGVPQPFLSQNILLSNSFFADGLPPSLLLSEGDDLGTVIYQAVAAAIPGIPAAIPETDGAFEILRNVALAITAVAFLLAGITTLTASVLIPAAAKELEKECLELNPELWREYQGKLEEGQTIADRPDLMQELGSKLQPLLDAKLAAATAKNGGVLPPPSFFAGGGGAVEEGYSGEAAEKTISATVVDLSSLTGNQWEDDGDSDISSGVVVDAEIVSEDSSSSTSEDSSSSDSGSDGGSDDGGGDD